ncbi:MAG: GNAT family N-acetyltransferase [Bacteroidota bacterium]
MHFKIRPYLSSDLEIWNDFIITSKNATFLFNRNFMDYHNDRFEDFSLMVYSKEKLIALLPANKKAQTLYSHQGLTYGGIIINENITLPDLETIFEAVVAFLKGNGFQNLVIKSFPSLYSSQPNEEVQYILNKRKAKIIHQNLILAIDYKSDFIIYKSKLKRYRKLESGRFEVREGISEFQPFWKFLLERRLAEKHNTKPVHTLDEILSLYEAFPKEIIQFNIYLDNVLLAGITIFKTKMTVKSQYGIASAQGEKLGALDMLFVYLIKKYQEEGLCYFSMGRINDDGFDGGYNPGMLKQKQEFGCHIYPQPVFELKLNG